jgi:hypothetical protein
MEFTHTDEGPHRGWRYYRLLEEDAYGAVQVLGYEAVGFGTTADPGSSGLWSLSPNPCTTVCRIEAEQRAPGEPAIEWMVLDVYWKAKTIFRWDSPSTWEACPRAPISCAVRIIGIRRNGG